MAYAPLVLAFIKLSIAFFKWAETRRLIEAGRAEALKEQLELTYAMVAKARTARDIVRDDADSVQNDADNRDNDKPA